MPRGMHSILRTSSGSEVPCVGLDKNFKFETLMIEKVGFLKSRFEFFEKVIGGLEKLPRFFFRSLSFCSRKHNIDLSLKESIL